MVRTVRPIIVALVALMSTLALSSCSLLSDAGNFDDYKSLEGKELVQKYIDFTNDVTEYEVHWRLLDEDEEKEPFAWVDMGGVPLMSTTQALMFHDESILTPFIHTAALAGWRDLMPDTQSDKYYVERGMCVSGGVIAVFAKTYGYSLSAADWDGLRHAVMMTSGQAFESAWKALHTGFGSGANAASGSLCERTYPRIS